MIRRAI